MGATRRLPEKLLSPHPPETFAQFFHINGAADSEAVHGHPDRSLAHGKVTGHWKPSFR